MRLVLLAAAMASIPALGFDCPATVSPAHRVALVELYTSEGCSSCPPADRWLSRLPSPAKQDRIVPVAFHVSYWDYIGWKDRFADARYTERQRAMAKVFGARSVYTPQVTVGGRDFRVWSHEAEFERSVQAINAMRSAARLEVVAQRQKSGEAPAIVTRVRAELPPGTSTAGLAVFTLLTQDRLSSRVTAGENRGELLRHDHVVRDIAVSTDWASGRPRAESAAMFARKPDWKDEDLSVVAFVQDVKSGAILQAVAAPVCR
jgi:hypothetical protein